MGSADVIEWKNKIAVSIELLDDVQSSSLKSIRKCFKVKYKYWTWKNMKKKIFDVFEKVINFFGLKFIIINRLKFQNFEI